MSGRKYSTISISEARGGALSACGAAETLAAEANALVAEMEQVADATDGARSFRDLQLELHQAAHNAAEMLGEVRTLLQSADLTVDQAQQAQRRASGQGESLQQVKNRVRASITAMGTHASVRAFQGRLGACRAAVDYWYPAEIREVETATAALQTAVADRVRKSDSTQAEEERLLALEGRLQTLAREASTLAEAARRRTFVADQLDHIGRKNLNCPVKRTQGENPRDPVRIEIDLGRVYGNVVFSLELDGMLRCQSLHLQRGTCEPWVEDVHQRLLRMGVETEFHYEETDLPVRKALNAKPTPIAVQRTMTHQAGG
jgi:hypothetical protein